ncbi:MAG: MBL fold metallo-hydrolase [Clostridia bacterium]|nr:MBL fold metallo-hydrolase [Clostridia bacterium]
MKIIIYRGTHEIGGTLIEVRSENCRILIDAGFPLLFNGAPVDFNLSALSDVELLDFGALPKVEGLYQWDSPGFDAVILSYAHLDHYGIFSYIHPDIPVYLSERTRKIIKISQIFLQVKPFNLNMVVFKTAQPFEIKDIVIKPFLVDHSCFDASAFEIFIDGKTLIYTGDLRGHVRKAAYLNRFIKTVKKQPDLLLIEGTIPGERDETIITEKELEDKVFHAVCRCDQPVLFQTSSQNIDRLVSFYKVAKRLKKTFVIDIYTANVLYELRQLGNRIPYPSKEYPEIRVFYPTRLTNKIFNAIGSTYAKRFSAYHISKSSLSKMQNNIIMEVRASMLRDIRFIGLHNGVFIYSMWEGYRKNQFQQTFEDHLKQAGFFLMSLHTSLHATISDIDRVITLLNPKKIVPVHTFYPESPAMQKDKAEVKEDREEFEV